MKFSVCLVLLVAVWQALAQAPGDEASNCVSQREAYPPNTKMLMDSRNYEQLITGSGGVWQALDGDGTGSGWASSFGGLCAAQPRSCDFRMGTSQNNWFFTQYIRYIDAREVFVNITANFQECRLNSACTPLYLDMYRYERNGVDATAARTTSNYQLVRRIEQPSGFSQQQYAASFSFTPSGNTNGFYLGFRDTGTCVNILRLQVYYRISPRRTVGLVTYPEIALPRQGSSGSATAIATCAANSRNLTSLQVTCFADGRCVDVASCACVPGHEYMAGAGGSGTCRVCSPGQFQPYLSNSTNSQMCLFCPPNSTSTVPASTVCLCDFGLSRNNSRPEDPCRKPPSSPRIAISRPPTVNGTTVELCWLQSLDSGGSPDLHYNIYVLESGDTEFRRVVTVQPMQSNMVCHTMELNALSSYSVAVTAASGATNDPQNFSDVSVVQDRFILFYVTTCAPVTAPPLTDSPGLSVPGAVAITFFVTLIFTAAITAAIVIGVVFFLRKKSNSSYKTSVPSSRSNGSSNEIKKKPPPPPRPRKV